MEATLDLIGGKWKSVILFRLSEGTRRFSELQRLLTRITPRMLAQQLRDLERDGLVHREVYAEVPPRVEYSLTDTGRTLQPVLGALMVWGEQQGLPLVQGRVPEDEDQVSRWPHPRQHGTVVLFRPLNPQSKAAFDQRRLHEITGLSFKRQMRAVLKYQLETIAARVLLLLRTQRSQRRANFAIVRGGAAIAPLLPAAHYSTHP